jgi:hypothetical protein
VICVMHEVSDKTKRAPEDPTTRNIKIVPIAISAVLGIAMLAGPTGMFKDLGRLIFLSRPAF